MISNYSVGSIDTILVLISKGTSIWSSTSEILDCLEERRKYVGIIIGRFVLQHRYQTLETHASIHVLIRQRTQRTIRLTIILNKNVVPDLQHVRIVLVDQMSSITPPPNTVVVDLTTGTAWALITHLPKVILHVPRENVVVRNTSSAPEILCFKIRLEATSFVTFKVGHVEPVGVEPVNLGEKLPRVGDSFLLEIVAKTPVPEHLEESLCDA